MTALRARVGAWLAVAMVAVAFALVLAAGDGTQRLRSDPLLSLGSVAVGFSVAGAAVWHRVRRVGNLLLAVGVSSAMSLLGYEYGRFALVEHGALPLGRPAAVAGSVLWAPGFGIATGVLPLLLPDGRLLSKRWRVVAGAAVVGIVLAALGSFLASVVASVPDLFSGEAPGGRAGAFVRVADAGRVLMLLAGLAAVASLVVRHRRANKTVRGQILWLVAGFAAMVVLLVAASLVDVGWILFEVAGVLAVPTALVIAIARHQLWDIERVVSRAAVYLAMSALVGLGYVAVIVAGVTVFRGRSAAGAGVIAAVAVAVAFQPARDLFQARVDRFVYGTRRDPSATLTALQRRIRVEATRGELLAAVVGSLREDLRLGYVGIDLDGVGLVASSGERRSGIELPLELQGKTLGTMMVGAEPGDQMGDRELVTLGAVAGQVALLVFASGLVEDLKRSREMIVVAREEERRRLRRDLHDGLGPALAGLALQAAAAVNLAASNPDRTAVLARRIADEATEITHDVRRLVHGLRPPALDELGLVAAIEQHATSLTAAGTSTLDVSVQGDGDLGRLPAAAEVAAYRLVTEALTNVHRHAQASRCEVLLQRDGCLRVEVRDNGRGIGDGTSSGVGLLSMQERVDELGGVLTIESGSSGTVVRAEVPIL